MITRIIRIAVLSVAFLASSFAAPVCEHFGEHFQSTVQAPAAIERGSRLVQEPSRRSLRPDFSTPHMRRTNQRSSVFMLRAFNEALGDSWKGTVQLLAAGEQIAMGAIVDSDGWILTKASQLPASGEITCRLFDGREPVATFVSKVDEHDLALVHIPETNLVPIQWETSNVPQRGKWLATTDLRATPVAVGVVSAGVQRVRAEEPRLGVSLESTRGGGAVSMVLPGSGADEAGVRIGDTVYSVNGKVLQTADEVLRAIKSGGRAGEYIRLGIDRAEKRFEVEARLMDLTKELLDPTEMEVNGRVSARSTGFTKVFLHDTVLEPQQCGGPLVNLDGRVVGINIARAGRVTSYALPADAIQPVVDGLLAQAKLVSAPTKESTLRPIR